MNLVMPVSRYMDIRWQHTSEADPVRLISAIGSDGFEYKQIEVFRDGSVGYATQSSKSHGTELGSSEVPPLNQILCHPEFDGSEISAADFDSLWRSLVSIEH